MLERCSRAVSLALTLGGSPTGSLIRSADMTPLDAVTRVQQALTTLARALESGRPDEVLSAEPSLADAASHLSAVDTRQLADPQTLRARLLETRLALDRCRALGDASGELISAMYPSESSYGRAGRRQVRATPVATVNSQV